MTLTEKLCKKYSKEAINNLLEILEGTNETEVTKKRNCD